MAHRYTYPVVDRALRNFLVFVLVLMVVVAVATILGASSEIIDLPMFYENIRDFESVSARPGGSYEFE